MDLIKTFLETAFCKYEYCEDVIYTLSRIRSKLPDEQLLLIDEASFVNAVRVEHPELSDDNLRMVYSMFRDRWSRINEEGRGNVFHSLLAFVNEMIVMWKGMPRVKFNHLFRWYELSQVVGEDLLVCAYLAGKELYNAKVRTYFGWPRILQTDNVELNRCFEREGLADLHQHLKASTDVFGISWACLMNHVMQRKHDFAEVFDDDPDIAQRMYEKYVEAAAIRLQLSKCVVLGGIIDLKAIGDVCFDAQIGRLANLQADINIVAVPNHGCRYLDYAWGHMSDDTEIFAGERKLLYAALCHIYRTGDRILTVLLHHYVLTKARIRERMVQINRNTGFANFDRYEKRKEMFIDRYPKYAKLLKSIPVCEAMKKHGVRYVETRIAPSAHYDVLRRGLRATRELIDANIGSGQDNCRVIYHFIRKKDTTSNSDLMPRNHSVRLEVGNQAKAMYRLLGDGCKFAGIDTANSEIFCRPEVFAHAYRYLDVDGIRRTYHVGEDYFDLTDGLRAIDEAVFFLRMRHGDRLGHCIAIAIDPKMYYESRRYHVPVPQQVLLDNLVWLYFASKQLCVTLPPRVEILILEKFRNYARLYGAPSIEDYYCSMLLRGNSPYYDEYQPFSQIIHDWKSTALDDRRMVSDNWKKSHIKDLFRRYHFDVRVKREGDKVVDFEVPREYPDVIDMMQDRMMDKIAKLNIAVECCPTSNVKIASLGRYEHHPIFRLLPVHSDGLMRPVATVNTDDLGIFSTSLDNEYALLALALLKQHDDSGRSLYDNRQVMRWIESLLRNGNAFRFA